MKLTQLRISNFQCFGEEPTVISLEPMTFLLGPNGAGKTSVLQALTRLFGFERSNALVQDETKPLIDSEMLDDLRQLWKRKKKLTSDIINAAKEIPSAQAYRNHFGGINEAYKLIGYPLIRDLSFGHAVRMSRGLRKTICDDICEGIRQIGGRAEKMTVPGLLRLNENVTVKVAIRKAWLRDGGIVWQLPLGKHPVADILVVGRLKPPERSIFDYFVIPAFSQLRGGLRTIEFHII
jgi:hypothetical protein